MIDAIQRIHQLGHNLLQKIKKILSEHKIGLWAGIVCVSGMTACDYGPIVDCCSTYGYQPENYTSNEIDTYRAMCYQTLTFDEKYNIGDQCKYKVVDRYIIEAKKCCSPLASTIESVGDYDDYDSSLKPVNAYTWCLLNTHPRTYKCDIEMASKLEADANTCCNQAYDKEICIATYMASDGKECVNISEKEECCNSLPENQTSQYISRSKCLEYYDRENICVKTPSVECCRNLSNDNEEKYIDNANCQMIYRESKGEYCINTDELLEKYNSGELCCENSPETENDTMISKSDCLNYFRSRHQCVTSKEEDCCKDLDNHSSNYYYCLAYYSNTQDHVCLGTKQLINAHFETVFLTVAKMICCDQIEDTTESGLTRDICINIFDEISTCVNTDELYQSYLEK